METLTVQEALEDYRVVAKGFTVKVYREDLLCARPLIFIFHADCIRLRIGFRDNGPDSMNPDLV
jgi:hypothetical protein